MYAVFLAIYLYKPIFKVIEVKLGQSITGFLNKICHRNTWRVGLTCNESKYSWFWSWNRLLDFLTNIKMSEDRHNFNFQKIMGEIVLYLQENLNIIKSATCGINEKTLEFYFKGATKSYFTHYSFVVIVFFNTALCRSAFSTVSFRKLVFCLSVFSLNQDIKIYVIMLCNFDM